MDTMTAFWRVREAFRQFAWTVVLNIIYPRYEWGFSGTRLLQPNMTVGFSYRNQYYEDSFRATNADEIWAGVEEFLLRAQYTRSRDDLNAAIADLEMTDGPN